MIYGLFEAINIANMVHKEQMYNDEPYIFHAMRVAMMGRTDEERILGVLHDTVEDGWATIATVRSLFGDTIADALDAISQRKGEDRDVYLGRCLANPLATRVKLNDNVQNYDYLPEVNDAARRKRLRQKYERENTLIWRAVKAQEGGD